MPVNPPPRGRKKDQTIFKKLDETFNDTFARRYQMFKRAEQTMRGSEERLRGRMEEPSERIRQRRAKVNGRLSNYDFTVDPDAIAKQITKTLKIRSTIMGLILAATILFASMMMIISNSKSTTNQQLTPTPIEETVTTNTSKKL